jgi:type II secretory pathway pseudopilin PulG
VSTKPATEPGKSPASAMGFKTKNLVIIGAVAVALWALAILSESLVFIIIVGVLTAVALGVFIWAQRLMKRQKRLVNLLQGAADSPQARKEAIAKLSSDKEANEVTHLFARAQLEAADDPKKALETVENIDITKVPPQMQDDVSLLRAQLYLHFGRPKEARPHVDRMNVDNPQRKEGRALGVAVVAETWARTGKGQEALALLETVDGGAEKDATVRAQLLVARVFARFAAGKKPGARKDLEALAALDVNYLGKFVMPQFRAHPELQHMARAVAEKSPQVRKMARPQSPRRFR